MSTFQTTNNKLSSILDYIVINDIDVYITWIWMMHIVVTKARNNRYLSMDITYFDIKIKFTSTTLRMILYQY